jgi:hypothetical protein
VFKYKSNIKNLIFYKTAMHKKRIWVIIEEYQIKPQIPPTKISRQVYFSKYPRKTINTGVSNPISCL